MKKLLLIILAAALLAAAPSAGAEYKKWQVTEGNWWRCFPLDAHNTVAVCGLWQGDTGEQPWYVCWYRDGEPYRELTGSVPAGDRNARLRIPCPAKWDGEHLSLYYCVLKGELKTYVQGTWIPTPDPGCFDVYMADWTEEGLENQRLLKDAWFDTYDQTGRGLLAWSGDRGRTAVYNGRETVLPDSLPVGLRENVLRILPVGDGVYLAKVMDNAGGCCRVACVDHGAERYRTTLPEEEFLPERILLPEGKGGFFCAEGYRPSGYAPEYLAHYGADGRYDRTLKLSGNRVVVHAIASVPGPGDALCTIYGSAVANSRKVYTVFAMTLDEDLNVVSLDVRKLDPDYGDYAPVILMAQDGTPYVYIESYTAKPLWPVLIPFSGLEKSKKTYGLALSR